jgi:hypothetical protein
MEDLKEAGWGWTELICLRIGKVAGSSECGKDLLASQEGLCSMGMVGWLVG